MQTNSNFQVYSASAGSGKTFTLVKEYLKIIISNKSPFVFQQILAITFTNKAAGEMKERVLSNLHAFSMRTENDMLYLLEKETGVDRSAIFDRSEKALDVILQNYASFSITTIDSFTHKLIRTFAYDLQLPLNFEVEMDGEQVLSEAVDMVVSKIGTQKQMTDLLVNYSLEKLEDDKAWDISRELKEFARILLIENHAEKLKSLSDFKVEDFRKLSTRLKKENNLIAEKFIEIGNKGLKLIDDQGIEYASFSYADLPNHFKKLQNFKFLKADDLKFEGRLFKTMDAEKPLFKATSNAAVKDIITGVTPQCRDFYYESKVLYDGVYGRYLLNKYIAESLIPLAVLSYINESLKEYKLENNMLLNAEFNALISDQIKDEPAPFIYERIGEKYRYFFIDEMQDTSEMQWQNLIPLLSNALSFQDEAGQMGSLMLVGDGKQSIYRWRGGNAEQFIALSGSDESNASNPFYVSKTVSNLATNFRSFSEVIGFNNSFFQHISKYLGNEDFKGMYEEGNNQLTNAKDGGYVEISFVENDLDKEDRELVFPRKVLQIIKDLDADFERSEICVLVRTKKQGVAVANYLSEQDIDIISSETLLLQNSQKVLFLIDFLKTIENENDKEAKVKVCYFLYEFLKVEQTLHDFVAERVHESQDVFFKSFESYGVSFSLEEFNKMALSQSVEYIVRSFNLLKKSDSNVQFFLDIIFEFQQKNEASIGAFLEFWELKKDKLSIVAPEAKGAVRIMTIHKAKGLEFPVVIYPYNLNIYRQINPKVWYKTDSFGHGEQHFLINYNNGLQKLDAQGVSLFEERRDELELDNFNLLYVALTRAVEQLYVIGELPSEKAKKEITTTSEFYKSFLEENNLWDNQKTSYYFGNRERVSKRPKSAVGSEFQECFTSSSWEDHQIHIVANSSLLWDTEQGDAIAYGNLMHAILSEIKSNSDVDFVIDKYLNSGQISSSEKEQVKKLILKVIQHSVLAPYFKATLNILTEREIMTDNKEIIIPDRLVFTDNNVVIIDYKTGKPDKKYLNQMNYYAKTLGELGYNVSHKYLVYIGDEILVEEV